MSDPIAQGCRPFEEDLSALVDGELAPAREAQVRAHLAGCGDCARRLEALCDADLALAGLAAPVVSPELARGLAQRISDAAAASAAAPAPAIAGPDEAAARRGRARPPLPVRRFGAKRIFGRAALAASLLLAAWLVLRGGEESGPPAPLLAEAPAPTAVEVPAVPAAESPRTPAAERAAPQLAREASPAQETLPGVADEDLQAIFALDAVEDLDVVANLELLETFVDLGSS